MRTASIVVAILAVFLPIVPDAKMPIRHEHHCPPPPGHEVSRIVTDDGMRQFCMDHAEHTRG